MPIKTLAACVCLLLPTGVLAQATPGPQSGPFTSSQQEPYRGPEAPKSAPHRPSNPARAQAERATADELRQWGERIDQLAGRQDVEADEIRNLRRQHQELSIQQGKLVQSQGAVWDNVRKQFDQARNRLASDFERAGGQVAETR